MFVDAYAYVFILTDTSYVSAYVFVYIYATIHLSFVNLCEYIYIYIS